MDVQRFSSVDHSSYKRLTNDRENNNNRINMTDSMLMEEIGYSFVISDKLLGKGSYGDVYLATDENNKKVAVKCCSINSNGIPNILEASIMGSTIHPYLNRALRILASDSKLYIIQELAVTDLSRHTKRNKNNYKPKLEELRNWCHTLSHAVAALHNENIIHADIKASNILLYENNTIRLTDYTLATKKWKDDDKFTHSVCTCTHRPLECLTKEKWNESLDIWSLGCTFYEIAYGELLFPHQGGLETSIKKDKNSKNRLRERSRNAIIEWATEGPNKESILNISKSSLNYISPVLCKEYYNPTMKVFNNLICKMLMVNPDSRLTIKEVINHPFFTGLAHPVYMFVKRRMNKIPLAEQARVSRHIQRYITNNIIQAVALNIYRSCNDMPNYSENIKAAGCTWIASKLVVGEPPTINLPLNQILNIEREICHNLLFRLH